MVLGLMTGSELVALGVIFVGKRIHSCGLFSGYFVFIVNRGLGYASRSSASSFLGECVCFLVNCTAEADPFPVCEVFAMSDRLFRRALFAFALVPAFALVGCSDDEGPASDGSVDAGTDATADAGSDSSGPDAGADDAGSTDTSSDTDAAADADTGVEVDENGFPICDTTGATDNLLAEGDYFLVVSLTPFGGLLVNFRAAVVADDTQLLSLELWSVSPDFTWESPAPVARACNVPVVDGEFAVSLPVVTIPAQGTTVGVEVDVIDFAFSADLIDTSSFCGVVDGAVPLLGVTLDASTFRAVPYGTQSNPPAAACGDVEVIRYEPISECPTLTEGANQMVSAELERTYVLYGPSDVFEGSGEVADLPLVFLFHGLGGDAEGMVLASEYNELVETERFILIAPDGANDADGGQVFPVDWNTLASQYDDDNRDLVYFDDLLKCVSEQFPVDLDRVYATGMSAGGLMTTFLGLHRSDVLAAVAPMSGGYLQAWPDDFGPVRPWLVTWGGEIDIAVDVNFNDTATALLGNLDAEDVPVVACNHNEGHVWPLEMTPANWAFLSAHVRGDTTNPFEDSLPEIFPEYCEIR